MSSHKRFLEMLARRAELSDSEERHLRRHLTECEDCWQIAISYERQAASIQSLPVLTTPSSLRPRVLAAVRQIPPRRRPWIERRRALFLAPLVAACLILFLALAQRDQHGARTTLSLPTSRSSPLPASATSQSTSAGHSTGKRRAQLSHSTRAAQAQTKVSVKFGPSTVAQNLHTTPRQVVRTPVNSALDAPVNDGPRAAQPHQGSPKKVSGGNSGARRSSPTLGVTPGSTPFPPPTSGAVIRAGPPQTVAQPIAPVRISTPAPPQPTPAPAPPKPTPLPQL